MAMLFGSLYLTTLTLTASSLEAPPSCTCEGDCSSTGCKIPDSERESCPYVWWDTPEYGAYATCVDARQKRVLTDFAAFPAPSTDTVTSQLPCASVSEASESLGYKSSVDTSPCFYPEITALYAEALQDQAYAGDAKQIMVRANVVDLSQTSVAWCKGDAWISGTTCFCSNGEAACSGAGCIASGGFSWYEITCADCECSGGGGFTKEIFEQSVPLLNSRKDIPFLNFTTAGYRRANITTADYTRIFADGVDTLSDSDIGFLFELFNSTYDAQMSGDSSSEHKMNEYLEIFVIPGFKGDSTAGFAHSRGHELNGSIVIPPAVYINEGSANSVKKAVPLLGHELGHTLGLLHTFSGLSFENLQGAQCKQCTPSAGNAATTGDFITDTPATSSLHAGSNYPAPMANSTESCTISFNSTGYCTELPGGEGNMRNLMGYGSDDCQATFTPQQEARMRCFMDQDFSTTHIADLAPGLVLLSATVSDATIQLAWLPPVSEVWCPEPLCSLDSYRISRSVNGSSWEVLGTTTGSTRVFTDSDLLLGCTYKYKVAAVNGSTVGAAVAKSVTVPGGSCDGTAPTKAPENSTTAAPENSTTAASEESTTAAKAQTTTAKDGAASAAAAVAGGRYYCKLISTIALASAWMLS
eukprot:gb/GFBE01055351.1/.p1 GENE.gb/GFBE01055351.1/~~gb/GFBE01055351.1/.p1  ORF type:complete len:641 (+),score=123.37 gb/GFBE01055351.1/:1-1923(+)